MSQSKQESSIQALHVPPLLLNFSQSERTAATALLTVTMLRESFLVITGAKAADTRLMVIKLIINSTRENAPSGLFKIILSLLYVYNYIKNYNSYYVCMQRNNEKTLQLTKKLGELLKHLRTSKSLSCTKLAYQFDIDKGNLSRIENGLIDCKFTTLWKISEALEIKLSDLIKILEKDLGKDFKIEEE